MDESRAGTAVSRRTKTKIDWTCTPLSSYEALVAGGDPLKETILRRCNANYDKIMSDIMREMLQQKIAALHYKAIDNAIYAPTMFITFLSASISIFGTSEVVSDPETKIWFSISVACLQLCLSILQSLSKQLDFGARAGFHRSASATLNRMYQNARHAVLETRIKTMENALAYDKNLSDGFGLVPMQIPVVYNIDDNSANSDKSATQKGDVNLKTKDGENENIDDNDLDKDGEGKSTTQQMPPSQQEDGDAAVNNLTQQFKQAVDQVDSFVPIKVANAYNVLESRITVINTSLLTSRNNSLVAWEHVLLALYYQLAETIIESRGFPYFLPGPRDAVEKTLQNFKTAITKEHNSADLIWEVLERSDKIADIQKTISQKRELRERRRTMQMSSVISPGRQKAYEPEPLFEDAKHSDDSDDAPKNYGSIV